MTTAVVIEHNLDVIASADHVLDLGPGGGVRGGEVVAQGTPENVAEVSESYTGQYLKAILSLSKGRCWPGAQKGGGRRRSRLT